MAEKRFLKADDIVSELEVSKSMAYKIIQNLNKELSAKGYITISGRIPTSYFYERMYCKSIS